MDLFSLTKQLVDIDSITPNEEAVGSFLCEELQRRGWEASKLPVEDSRANVCATWPSHRQPAIVMSTHMDTVPPFIKSSEDETRIYGRGSCDAKGIIAAQIMAAERLREEGVYVGLLFLVGEERDSLGARVANRHAQGSRFLINGEPTENRIALASKGSLRVELSAKGKMAHSAYPELGESAIEKLVRALSRLLDMQLPSDSKFGDCTLNIGVIQGGRAPNVIPDFAKAELLYRLIGPSTELRKKIIETVGKLAEVHIPLDIPFMELQTVGDFPTMVAAFTTDIPALNNWGKPVLVGPGSIHVAHTTGEYVEKQQLRDAVDLYCQIAKQLMS